MRLMISALCVQLAVSAAGKRSLQDANEEEDYYWGIPVSGYHGACFGPSDATARTGSRVVLLPDDDPCYVASGSVSWYFDVVKDLGSPTFVEVGIFRSSVDFNQCIQVGRDDETPQEGTRLRMFPCDPQSASQLFEYDYINAITFHDTSNKPKLCMDHRGRNADFGRDPMILKDCNKVEDNWCFD